MAKAKALEIPKGEIGWLVGRLHVSVSDEAVRADIRKRTAGNPGWTEAKVKQAERYAVKCHRENQAFYHAVMSGRL